MTARPDSYDMEDAREIVLLARDTSTGLPSGVGIVGASGDIELMLSFAMALAVSQRLVELVAELPSPPRLLRRSADIDLHLRALEN